MTPSIPEIAANPTLIFDPQTARAIAQQCNSANQAFGRIATSAQRLTDTGSAGNFGSATGIQKALTELGRNCSSAVTGLRENAQKLGDAVRAAGSRIESQDEDTANALKSAGDMASGYPKIGLPISGSQACLPSDPGPSAKNLGPFPCPAIFEAAPGGGVVDWGFTNSLPADEVSLNALVKNWMMVARDIAATVAAFESGVNGLFASGTWTGTAADGVREGLGNYMKVATQAGQDSFTNATAVSGWVAGVLATKSGFEGLKSQQDAANFAYNGAALVSPAAIQQHQIVMSALDQAGRDVMNSTYNPANLSTATSLINLPDTTNVGPTVVPFGFVTRTAGSAGGGGAGVFSGRTSSGASGGGGGAGGGGGGATTAANKATSDAAQGLTRQATGDPVAAATENAAGQAGQNPASAAQSAMSKASDGAKSLGGNSSGSPLTRSAGLGGLSDAEKAAKASALGKAGGAAGGGAGGGGGKVGGIGAGAGAAAPEGSLSARSSGTALTAAERALAGQQAAPATGRAGGMSPGMGGRGAGNKEEDKEHTVARYLVTAEHGDEIAGELPDVAPEVIGGLNLDTTDNPPTN